MAKRPKNLGLVEGRLRPCPDSPNCVCTEATDDEHKIEPLSFEGPPEEAMARLKRVIESLPRTKIVTEKPGYVHVEFTTLIFRFVDDVEFALDEEAGKIDFRSASRVGYSDLGTNRRRMETVRAKFNET
ncbi:MAG: DUF1499 domain-containing protein [Planctomycetota bacterium]|nr:MAG: DUF1499 domain-containing protein [Planctomycetota bacterium]